MINRTTLYLIILVLVSMGALLAMNMPLIINGQIGPDPYFKPYGIQGSAIRYQQLLYTLNFKQQNHLIKLLNQAVPIQEIPTGGEKESVEFEEIIIYQFEGLEDIILKPIIYLNHNLIYSTSHWNQGGYFMDVSEGELQQLLLGTYDH